MKSSLRPLLLATAALSLAASAQANTVVISEWMYNGSEFVEFTNIGTTAIDMTGWSYDDESRETGTVSLSDFGTLAVGESAILAEADAATFRTEWSLAGSVKVIGGNAVNLGRNDEINLFDASGTVIDRLRYGDSTYVPGTIRTQDVSGNPATLALLAGDDSTGWVLSTTDDAFGSYASTTGFVGNPGTFALAPAVPEPANVALALAGLLVVSAVARRRSAV